MNDNLSGFFAIKRECLLKLDLSNDRPVDQDRIGRKAPPVRWTS
jgi:hypothetical protein